MVITDELGLTLQGVVDGTNQLFTTSLLPDPDTLQVYVNGRLKMLGPEWEDGADYLGQSQLRTREPLLLGDTISVSYSPLGTGSFGGQGGGIPPLAATCQDGPPAITCEADATVPPTAEVDLAPPPEMDVDLPPPPFCCC